MIAEKHTLFFFLSFLAVSIAAFRYITQSAVCQLCNTSEVCAMS